MIERAREELAAARLLAEGGFHSQGISRAYFAAFSGAEAALLELGETRSKHSGVISAFGQHLVGQHGFDADVARLLRSLFRRRGAADYGGVAASRAEADAAIADAERFVRAVERWLEQREPWREDDDDSRSD